MICIRPYLVPCYFILGIFWDIVVEALVLVSSRKMAPSAYLVVTTTITAEMSPSFPSKRGEYRGPSTVKFDPT